ESVPEIAPPPILERGSAVIPFTISLTDGTSVSFPDDFRGKVVLLTFWSSDCGYCRDELPHLKEAHERFSKEGFEILSVSIDTNPEAMEAALREVDAKWLQARDGEGGW